jgi:hypothetical protein
MKENEYTIKKTYTKKERSNCERGSVSMLVAISERKSPNKKLKTKNEFRKFTVGQINSKRTTNIWENVYYDNKRTEIVDARITAYNDYNFPGKYIILNECRNQHTGSSASRQHSIKYLKIFTP